MFLKEKLPFLSSFRSSYLLRRYSRLAPHLRVLLDGGGFSFPLFNRSRQGFPFSSSFSSSGAKDGFLGTEILARSSTSSGLIR